MIKAIVPESLNDMTLGQMQRYDSLIKDVDDPKGIRMLMLATFCGIDIVDYERANATQIMEVVQRVEAILNTEPRHELFFVMNDVKYGFIPNLDEMTMGEFVDLENLSNDIADWHKIMSILYRPVTKTFGKRYQIEDYTGTGNAAQYKQMPLGVALGAMLFFWNLGKDLLTDTLRYFKEAMTAQRQNIHLQESGIGLEQYTDSLKETLDALTKSHPYRSTLASIGSVTKQT